MKLGRQARQSLLGLLVVAGCACLGGAASSGQEQPGARATTPSFDAEIRSIFQARCWRCHGEQVQKGELALHTPERIRKGGESGEILVPGKLAESRLFELISTGEMPADKKNPPTPAEVELIRRWIEGGAPFVSDGADARPGVTQHEVLPILLLRCTVCHGRHKQEGDLDLRSRAAMLKGGKSGPAIVPGKPDESLLVKRVRAGEMPPNKRLIEVAVKPMEADELAKLERWIELGAQESPDEPDLAGTPDDPLVRPQDKEFWSFRPPQAQAIPNVADGQRLRTPVDAFVLEKLAAKSLTLSPETDRLTLLRRASFDLTGLPPEPVEAQAFVADQSPDAYERVIDRLLASPRYGERWGRHWLDVAGYADCEGRREQHLPRPEAWRYRDYVIRALNADKPYDRFLQEQLAGDELADYEHAAEITQELEDNLVATAFLRMSPDPTWANLTGFVPDRLEVMADAIDVLGSGVMGLTFKCARCHSHKFDPIPQRDYYRLLAIFKGAFDEHDWLKPQIKSFGGAFSAGIGERYLPYVATAERNRWQANEAKIQAQSDALKAMPQTDEKNKQIKELESQRRPEPRIAALWDRGEPSPTYIYRRGNYLSPGALVQPGVPAALVTATTAFEVKPPYPGAISTGRRLAFARWLTAPDHPLTARVMVNSLWMHHFGRGIVRSVGNFGKTGTPPTHPELLDYLARSLSADGWSLKRLHRLIVNSATYRQASKVSGYEGVGESGDGEPNSLIPTNPHTHTPASALDIDPDNKFLWRQNMRRQEAEELRDTLLLVAGEIQEKRYGPPEAVTVRPDGLVLAGSRRSIYVEQLRKYPPSLLESFDLPAMNPNCLARTDSLVATQALHLWNDAAVRKLASQFADRVRREVGDDRAQQITQAYLIALGRPPTAEELDLCTSTLDQLTDAWISQTAAGGPMSHEAASRQALATLCHTLVNSASFLYLD